MRVDESLSARQGRKRREGCKPEVANENAKLVASPASRRVVAQHARQSQKSPPTSSNTSIKGYQPARPRSGVAPEADVYAASALFGSGPRGDSCIATMAGYSIRSSAPVSSAGGTVRPSALAVLRLMMN